MFSHVVTCSHSLCWQSASLTSFRRGHLAFRQATSELLPSWLAFLGLELEAISTTAVAASCCAKAAGETSSAPRLLIEASKRTWMLFAGATRGLLFTFDHFALDRSY